MFSVIAATRFSRGGPVEDLEDAVWGSEEFVEPNSPEASLMLTLAEFEAGHCPIKQLQFECELYVFEVTGTLRYPERPEIPNNVILGED